MLFEGLEDLSPTEGFTDKELDLDPTRHKLLSRDSIDLIAFISLGIGILILFYAHMARYSKEGHAFLPRPNQC